MPRAKPSILNHIQKYPKVLFSVVSESSELVRKPWPPQCRDSALAAQSKYSWAVCSPKNPPIPTTYFPRTGYATNKGVMKRRTPPTPQSGSIVASWRPQVNLKKQHMKIVSVNAGQKCPVGAGRLEGRRSSGCCRGQGRAGFRRHGTKRSAIPRDGSSPYFTARRVCGWPLRAPVSESKLTDGGGS